MKNEIDFSKGSGLVPVIIQDDKTSAVLMLGYMNKEAYDKTMEDKIVTFWSRSKERLWRKGETSGNFLHLVSSHVDCDSDTLLLRIKPQGPTCHTGSYSCFDVQPDNLSILTELETVISQRARDLPEGSYTTSLFKGGTSLIAQKVGEEAVETVVAALDQNLERLHEESADLIYHLLVLLHNKGTTLSSVLSELEKRR
ncbi:MAG: bifunctional phosphoribosyl-AMP cyclohydrolase/phosphoribosyl-ATP diphosphatase HisIE [Candidatus Marinimicrobia bacterium]|nr:bifunctional phosphoribosyl-AMP cyclohydrolase/phosphoribosyl-ATP diphosphatase HisIE [Candidatus Neomarinimicrobiota bacterium]